MRSSFTAGTGLKLARTPSAREQAHRRRLAVLAAVGGLALGSALFGMLAPPTPHPAHTGPFSYFPSE